MSARRSSVGQTPAAPAKILTATEKEAAEQKRKAKLSERVQGFDPYGFADEKPAPVRKKLPTGSTVRDVLEKEEENKIKRNNEFHYFA